MAGAQILIVEYDQKTAEELRAFFGEHGIESTLEENRSTAFSAVKRQSYDLLLINNKPGLDGFTLLKPLYQHVIPPIIHFTPMQQSDVNDQLADLLVMVRSRLTENRPRCLELSMNNEYQFENLRIDSQKKQAYLNAQVLNVTQIEYELLRHLVTRRGETLHKERLYSQVLNRAYNEHDRSLDMHISNLRKKLNAAGFDVKKHLKTVRKKGYQLC